MTTHMITQALSALALTGLMIAGGSNPQPISGERALLNRSDRPTDSPVTATAASWEQTAIDPTQALLGRSIEAPGSRAVALGSVISPKADAAASALLGRVGDQ